MTDQPNINCSFCGRGTAEVKTMVSSTNLFICDVCVETCVEIIESRSAEKSIDTDEKAIVERTKLTPRAIKEHLDAYIVGQHAAKRAISIAVYKHYKRLRLNETADEQIVEKSNVLLLGPTGSGKTLIAQTIARFLDVPFAIADATSLTETGYIGDDAESVVVRLIQNAGYDVARAERGIIYIDEIDKKAAKAAQNSTGRDVSGEGVQQALLKIMEGTEVTVPGQGGRRNQSGEMFKVDTRNILFIVAGAFIGLEKIIEQDGEKSRIGFSGTVQPKGEKAVDLLKDVRPDHLTKYGLIPEFVGRLPIITSTTELTADELVRVLTEPKNAIVRQFRQMFEAEGIDLVFTDEALRAIADVAQKRKTGARGLRGVMEKALETIEFDLPDLAEDGVDRIVITEDTIRSSKPPEMTKKNVDETI